MKTLLKLTGIVSLFLIYGIAGGQDLRFETANTKWEDSKERERLCMFCSAELTNDEICDNCDMLQTDPYDVEPVDNIA